METKIVYVVYGSRTEIRDPETRQKGGRKYLYNGKVNYLYQF